MTKLVLFRIEDERKLASLEIRMSTFQIRRATYADLGMAYRIVAEYYDAANVIARETEEQFHEYYFGDRSGIWLATMEGITVGCIALRELSSPSHSAEIKRMYVQPAHRQHGIAKALLDALELFALNAGYDCLYLDSAPGMDTAVAFYRRHGYVPCDRYNQNPQANIFLRKQLR